MNILATFQDQVKELKQRRKKEKFLRQLVSAYSSPWAKERGNFRSIQKRAYEEFLRKMNARFESDRHAILARIVQELGIQDLSQMGDVTRRVLALVATGKPGMDTRDLDQTLQSLNVALAAESKAVPETQVQETLTRILLDRIIEEGTVPRFFDYDHIDDIVPIVLSRYRGANGTTDSERSQRFLDALWLLGGQALPVDEHRLSEVLRGVLGKNHGYVPPRGKIDPQAADTIPDLVNEFINMRGEDNPKRFLDINLEYSMRVRTSKEPSYAKRDLSLIRGWEANHHLMLRTIITLINEGKISRNDEVLIIGPRHVDEILFFRHHLGLKNTIGLDLFNEKDMIFYGDMHDMPFEDNRFRLIFSAKTFPYAYNLRKVINELGRVLQRPGYIVNIDSAGRAQGPDPLGRTDTVDLETVLSMYYPFAHNIIAQDPGRSHNPEKRSCWPCYAIELIRE